jgi:amino acid transporter
VMAEDRMMPSALARRNRRRSPWVAILLCGLGWALALGFTYERLISIDLILYGASLVLEFAALIALRINQPEMERPFRVPGGMVGVWVVSVCPVALLVYAAYVSRSEQVAHMPALLFGLLVAAGGPVCYLLSRWWWGRPIPTPQPTEIAAD